MKTVLKRTTAEIVLGIGCCVGVFAQTYSVKTVAPTPAATVDETSALAPLSAPVGIALDSAGNIFFCDTGANKIKKIDVKTLAISTIAGTGTAGNTGDGGPAAKAAVSGCKALVFDSTGNLFISDSGNSRIRKIDSAGVITLVAGTSAGFSGDGKSALTAQLSAPSGIAIDSDGNLYIADTGNNRIRRVDKKGIISTVIGSASGSSGDGGPAALAKLNAPQGVAVDSKGNVFVADTGNHLIRMVTVVKDSTGKPLDFASTASTVAGGTYINTAGAVAFSTTVVDGAPGPLSGLNSPRGLSFDSNGKLYISSQGDNRVRVFDPATGTINATRCGASLGTGTGAATNLTCGMLAPESAVVGADGSIFVAETGNNRISQITPDGSIRTLAGVPNSIFSGGASVDNAGGLRGLAVDPTNHVVVTDTGKNIIRRIETDGSLTTVAGNGVSGLSGDTNLTTTVAGAVVTASLAPTARVAAPWNGVYDAAGNFYFADRGNHRVRKVDTNGNISTIAGSTIQVRNVTAAAPRGTTVNLDAGYYGDGKLGTIGQLDNPTAVAVDALGNVYIAEQSNNVVRKIDANGFMSTFAGFAPACGSLFPTTTNAATPAPGGAQVLGTGTGAPCVGVAGYEGDGSPAIYAQLSAPRGVAADALGNVYIADTGNNVVRVVTVDGIISSVGPAGSFNGPRGLAVDKAGNLFVANTGANNIRRVDAKTGAITTIAGGGTDYSDNADATKTRVNNPYAVAVDANGDVYFTDFTSRVRELIPAAK